MEGKMMRNSCRVEFLGEKKNDEERKTGEALEKKKKIGKFLEDFFECRKISIDDFQYRNLKNAENVGIA